METIPIFDKIFVISKINEQIRIGNLEFAKILKRDLVEYLKENNKEFEWAEKISINDLNEFRKD